MKKLCLLFSVSLLVFPVLASAGTTVVEGDDAVKLYQTEKGKAQTLVQKNKEFVLRAPNGKETPKPETVTVKAGERFYIANEEMTFVHNVWAFPFSVWNIRR